MKVPWLQQANPRRIVAGCLQLTCYRDAIVAGVKNEAATAGMLKAMMATRG